MVEDSSICSIALTHPAESRATTLEGGVTQLEPPSVRLQLHWARLTVDHRVFVEAIVLRFAAWATLDQLESIRSMSEPAARPSVDARAQIRSERMRHDGLVERGFSRAETEVRRLRVT